MQQTVDVDVETKDQMVAETDADLATILVSGLSYFSYAVAVTLLVQDAADVDAVMTAAYGSSSYCSSVAVLETITIAVVAVATTVATKRYHSLKASAGWQELYIFYLYISYIFITQVLGGTMKDDVSQLMTPFDQYISTESLQMAKLLIPFLPPKTQRMLAVYIKFSEFQHTITFFRSMRQASHAPEDLISSIKPYMSSADMESFDQMMSMMNMMSMVQEMQTMPGFDPTSMMSGLFSQEEHNDMQKEGESSDGLVKSSDATEHGSGEIGTD